MSRTRVTALTKIEVLLGGAGEGITPRIIQAIRDYLELVKEFEEALREVLRPRIISHAKARKGAKKACRNAVALCAFA